MILGSIFATIIYTFISWLVLYFPYFVKMATLFSVTYMLKRLFKSSNNKQTADLIGLGGYSLTVAVFFSLINAIVTDICTVL